jgi:hypothetical protein
MSASFDHAMSAKLYHPASAVQAPAGTDHTEIEQEVMNNAARCPEGRS